MIELYTDGASSGNPGPGGYGTILRAIYQGANPEFQGKKQDSMNAATLSYYGLYSLQHRGQESAGICVSDGEEVKIHKAMGLVSDVFMVEHLQELKGNLAIGHVRYATAGSKTVENAQPMLIQSKLGLVAVAHNGQLVNYIQLREMFEETGATFSSTSDTEVIVKLIARGYKKGLERALTDTIQMDLGGSKKTITQRPEWPRTPRHPSRCWQS